MSAYGQVIDGGSQMRKGVSKGINDKLESLDAKREARKTLATAVNKAFKGNHLSDPMINNVQVGQKSTKFGGKKGTNMDIGKSPKNI